MGSYCTGFKIKCQGSLIFVAQMFSFMWNRIHQVFDCLSSKGEGELGFNCYDIALF